MIDFVAAWWRSAVRRKRRRDVREVAQKRMKYTFSASIFSDSDVCCNKFVV